MSGLETSKEEKSIACTLASKAGPRLFPKRPLRVSHYFVIGVIRFHLFSNPRQSIIKEVSIHTHKQLIRKTKLCSSHTISSSKRRPCWMVFILRSALKAWNFLWFNQSMTIFFKNSCLQLPIKSHVSPTNYN